MTYARTGNLKGPWVLADHDGKRIPGAFLDKSRRVNDDEDIPGVEFASQAERTFFISLVRDADMMAVLRGHLYVEHALHDVLKARLGRDAEVVYKDLDFYAKYVLARRLKLLTKAQARQLQALSELRNSFAHTLERILTLEDEQKLFKALDDKSQLAVKDYLNKHPERVGAGGAIARLAILMIRVDIASTAAVLQKWADEGRAVINPGAINIEELLKAED